MIERAKPGMSVLETISYPRCAARSNGLRREGNGPLVAGRPKRGSGGLLDVGQVSHGLPQEGVDGGVGAPHVVRSGGVEARAFTQSPLQTDDVREGRVVQLRAGLDTGEIEVPNRDVS